ncbi:hypothetical protein [Streptomyces sp. NBC_00470]|uniref:hypothetical protein n=1 Tax=Streptomyces sp. NBC_00470 TaxID=2975753 RepID=UPI0030E43056
MPTETIALPVHAELLEIARKRKNATTGKQFQQAVNAFVKYSLAQAGGDEGTLTARKFYETEMVRYAELVRDEGFVFIAETAEVELHDVAHVYQMAAQELATIAVDNGCPVPKFVPDTRL